jgi:hypothetical protein
LQGTPRVRASSFPCLRIGIVHPVEHHVLEGHEVARRLLKVALAGPQQLAQGILPVDRHQLIAQTVIRCMQGNRQRYRTLVTQAIHRRHQARGRYRHPATRQTIGIVVKQHAQGRYGMLKVGQRFAHAHQHDIADDALVLRILPWVGTQGLPHLPKLTDNLGHRQIAVETLLAGRAERAVKGTTRLRRNAERPPFDFRNEDRFDGVTAADIEKEFARTIVRDAVRDHRRRQQPPRCFLELPAQALGDVGHRIEIILPERCNQRSTCVARKAFSPCSAKKAVRPALSRSSRFTVIWVACRRRDPRTGSHAHARRGPAMKGRYAP